MGEQRITGQSPTPPGELDPRLALGTATRSRAQDGGNGRFERAAAALCVRHFRQV